MKRVFSQPMVKIFSAPETFDAESVYHYLKILPGIYWIGVRDSEMTLQTTPPQELDYFAHTLAHNLRKNLATTPHHNSFAKYGNYHITTAIRQALKHLTSFESYSGVLVFHEELYIVSYGSNTSLALFGRKNQRTIFYNNPQAHAKGTNYTKNTRNSPQIFYFSVPDDNDPLMLIMCNRECDLTEFAAFASIWTPNSLKWNLQKVKSLFDEADIRDDFMMLFSSL